MLTYANVLLTGLFALKDTHEDSDYFHIQIRQKSNYRICERAEPDVLRGGGDVAEPGAFRGRTEVEDN